MGFLQEVLGKQVTREGLEATRFRVGDRVLLVGIEIAQNFPQMMGKVGRVILVAETWIQFELEVPVPEYPDNNVTAHADILELVLDPRPWNSTDEAEAWLSERGLI